MDWQIIVKEVIEDRHITYAALARECGIKKGWMHELVHGRIQNPSFEKGVAILRLYPKKKEIIGGLIN